MDITKPILFVTVSLSMLSCGMEKKDEDKPDETIITTCFDCPPSPPPQPHAFIGTILFDSVPWNVDEGRLFLLVDEKSPYTQTRTRILEQRITPIDDYIECDLGLSKEESLSLRSPIIQDILGRRPITESTYNSNPLKVGFDFEGPDARSEYFAGILMDLDHNGKPSPGDYFSTDFVSFIPSIKQTDMVFRLSKIDEEPFPLFHIRIGNIDEVAAAEGAQLHFTLLSLSTGTQVSSSVVELENNEATFPFIGIPPRAKDLYALKVNLTNKQENEAEEWEESEPVLISDWAMKKTSNARKLPVYEVFLSLVK